MTYGQFLLRILSVVPITVLWLPAPLEAQGMVGVVAAMHGAWKVELHGTPIPLHRGDSVPVRGLIHPPPRPTAQDLIDIELVDGKTHKSRICAREDECSDPFALPGMPKEPSMLSRAVAAVAEWVRGKPRPRVPLISAAPAPAPAVLRLNGSYADLSSALEQLPSGRFTLSLTPVDAPRAPRALPPGVVQAGVNSGREVPSSTERIAALLGRVTGAATNSGGNDGQLQSASAGDHRAYVATRSVEWEPGRTRVPMLTSRPGLYRLIITGPKSGSTLVLVSNPGQFTRDSAQFEKGRQAVQTWVFPAGSGQRSMAVLEQVLVQVAKQTGQGGSHER